MLFERVKELADKRKKSLNEVEEAVDLPKNTLYRWRTKMPNAEKLQAVADYFNVSTDYLLGRENYTTKKKVDLHQALIEGMSYDGEDLSENDMSLIKSLIGAVLKERGYDVDE